MPIFGAAVVSESRRSRVSSSDVGKADAIADPILSVIPFLCQFGLVGQLVALRN
jgi:hypothetical protein